MSITTTFREAAADHGAVHAVRNIVLVHGAFVGPSSWDKVAALLRGRGFTVTAVENPLTSLGDDVAATRAVLAAQDGPTILVGHSWGGVVIGEAGDGSSSTMSRRACPCGTPKPFDTAGSWS